ncbi:cell division protein FtsX [Cognatishimia activa]|uniref:Cell division protein FtsX n=1 Tax=Cognatishimia activa TaxID=1715691 RepID=A0A975I865_9RHOB|nr:FtsX-like permease family protein [Cognatishimia activa]QTN36640.1 cell division protein FtsX [Cognatishimia activa]
MNRLFGNFLSLFSRDAQADRMVPPTGFTARLTLFSAAAMAFLVVFALALSMATGRLAQRWGEELANGSTLRISAPLAQLEQQTAAALNVLETTPGIAGARALTADEQRALLSPWFGPDLPIEDLPIPQLIEISETEEGYDAAGLRLRLQAEVPGAILDDHSRWRKPLQQAAMRLRMLGWLAIGVIAAVTGTMITLAANAALAANSQVIAVMRLVGAQDEYIARAFVRRFTLRALMGAAAGTVAGYGAVLLLPSAQGAGGFLTGLGFQGYGALWLAVVPFAAAAVAFLATGVAARKSLSELS